MSWIRWQGLIGFGFIVALVFTLWLLLTGPMLKHSIEKNGTDIVGAKVELKSARLSLEPIGVKLENFQMTNIDKPMSNLLEFNRAEVSVDFLKLLMGQVVINDLALEGIQFNTPREKSGAINNQKSKSTENNQETSSGQVKVSEIKNKVPSVDEILQKEPLLTLERKAELELAYDEEKVKLDAVIKQLPEKDALKVYEQRIKKLTKDDIKSLEDALARKKELDSIKSDIKHDKKAIKSVSRQIKESKKRLSTQLSFLKKAPAEDLKNIKTKYSLSGDGVTNISKLLIGDQAGEWADMALQGYGMAEPFMGESDKGEEANGDSAPEKIRAEGKFIHFLTRDPIPDFLLRKASLEIILDTESIKGTLKGKLKDFTPQPEIIRRPAKLELSGSELKGLDSVVIQGVFNHIDPLNPVDAINFNIKGMPLKDKRMGNSDKLELNMVSSIIDIQGKAVFEKGRLDSKVDSRFSETHFTGQGKDSWARELVALLAKIKSFDVQILLAGQIKDFDISISSDLDNKLKAAMKTRVAKKKNELEIKLMARLNEEISSLLNTSGSELDSMNNQQTRLDSDLNHADELLKAQVSDYKAQQKQKLEDKKQEEIDKLKEKLNSKFKF